MFSVCNLSICHRNQPKYTSLSLDQLDSVIMFLSSIDSLEKTSFQCFFSSMQIALVQYKLQQSMGGQLIKGYSIEGDSLCHVGLHKSWKLYKGHNSSTHVSASIFLIEKKQLKKNDRQETIKFAKKESTNLLRVRHPGVLAVIEPLTEDQNILAFVAEKIQGNFTFLIKQNKFQEFMASELELKLFLYPFLETLTFIHDTLKQAHLQVSLETIFVTGEGKWKLAGFGHNQQVTSDELTPTHEKILDYSFSAPELAIQQSYCKKSDIFSLGLIILRLVELIHHKTNKVPPPCSDKHQYEKTNGDTKNIAVHPVVQKSDNPSELSQLLKGMLCWDHNRRSNSSDVLYSSWMNDSTLMTVKHLDKISNYQSKQQLDFLKGLAGVLDDFPMRVTNRIVVPKLLDLLKFNNLIASIIYILIDLLKKKKIQQQVFKKSVWPSLKTVTQGKQMTAQAIYLLVINIQIFQKNITEADITSYLMPLYLKCYDCPPKLKQLALSMLEKISKKVEYQFVKTKIIPKLIMLLKDPNLDIRKDALKGLNSILQLIDNQTVTLSVLPGLEAARKAGSDAFVNAIITHMHKKLGESLPIDVLSSKILPTLLPYLTDPSLSRSEFLQFKSLIFQMIERIEKQSAKQFDSNSLQNFTTNFTEADFKFKQTDTKPTQTKKGDYNFLANYIQPKIETTPNNTPFTETTPNAQIPERKETPISPSLPSAGSNFTFPQHTEPIGTTATYNFESLSSNYNQDLFAPSSTPAPTVTAYEPPQKIEEKDPYLDTDYFESLEAKKAEEHEKKYERPKVVENPKFLSGPNLNKKSSEQTYIPPSPPKEQRKIMGGASGPMQIKKLKGPPPPSSKPKKPTQPIFKPSQGLDFNFQKKEERNFQMNFDNYNSFDMGTKPAVEKKQASAYSGSFSFQNDMFGSKPSESSNPFEQIQKEMPPISFPTNPKPADKSTNQDIYSYFESDSKPTQSTASKNSFDLI